MSNGVTLNEVVTEAERARAELIRLDDALQGEIREIDRRIFRAGDNPNQEDKDLRETRREQQNKIQNAFRDQAFENLQRLSQAQELQQLADRMREINRGLAGDLASLQRIALYTQTVAEVADALNKVVNKAASLAAELA